MKGSHSYVDTYKTFVDLESSRTLEDYAAREESRLKVQLQRPVHRPSTRFVNRLWKGQTTLVQTIVHGSRFIIKRRLTRFFCTTYQHPFTPQPKSRLLTHLRPLQTARLFGTFPRGTSRVYAVLGSSSNNYFSLSHCKFGVCPVT